MSSNVTRERALGNHSLLGKHLIIGANCKLTLSDIKLFTQASPPVSLGKDSESSINHSHEFLKSCVDQRIPIYGVNTNFGDQVTLTDPYLKDENTTLYQESIIRRQENIIKSLACGLGEPTDIPVVRTTMLLRAHCLAQGYSGVSASCLQAILNFLNSGITPIVRRYGSIGASGDLIPLSMIASALIGSDVDVHYQNKIMKAKEAIVLAGLNPFQPQLRDGLALINGTSFMTGITSISLYKLQRLYKQMLAAIAMSLEAMLVITSAYHPLVHLVKRQLGQCVVNEFFTDFWKDSQLTSNLDEVRKNENPQRSVQDYYSLRSVPQGFGPFQENLETAIKRVENEMNSVNDNPIVDLKENTIHHGANFMGYYITDTCDMLKNNIAQASTWIHALMANLVHPRKNNQLPANIVPNPEQNNGFRSIQLLTTALAVQNRKLAQSQQAYMLPTEGDNQDVNSLGTHAAFDFQEAVINLERLTALLFLAATQALELRGSHKASSRAQSISQLIRSHSPSVLECRPMTDEIHSIMALLDEERI